MCVLFLLFVRINRSQADSAMITTTTTAAAYSLFRADAATRGCHVRVLVKGYHMVTPPFFLPYPNHSLFRWLNEALRCIPKFQCVLTGLGDKVFQKRGLKREEAGIRRYGCLQNMLVLGAYN